MNLILKCWNSLNKQVRVERRRARLGKRRKEGIRKNERVRETKFGKEKT